MFSQLPETRSDHGNRREHGVGWPVRWLQSGICDPSQRDVSERRRESEQLRELLGEEWPTRAKHV